MTRDEVIRKAEEKKALTAKATMSICLIR